jgi:hypothetical protein
VGHLHLLVIRVLILCRCELQTLVCRLIAVPIIPIVDHIHPFFLKAVFPCRRHLQIMRCRFVPMIQHRLVHVRWLSGKVPRRAGGRAWPTGGRCCPS